MARNAAILSLINAVMRRMLPVHRPQELVLTGGYYMNLHMGTTATNPSDVGIDWGVSG